VRRLGILYASGSAGPAELLDAAHDSFEPVFLVASDDLGESERALAELALLVEARERSDAALAAELERLGVASVVTFSDPLIRRAAALNEFVGGTWHSPRTAVLVTDKRLQRQELNDRGVSSVRFASASSAEALAEAVESVGYPAVIKPARGHSSIDVVPVTSPEDVRDLVPRLGAEAGGWLVEELLAGVTLAGREWLAGYVSVESVVAAGVPAHVCVVDKLPPVWPFRETGQILPSALGPPHRESALAAASSAIEALCIRAGPVHTEIMLTSRGPVVIEVNGRLGGSMRRLIKSIADYDLLRAACESVLGLPAVAPDEPFERVAIEVNVHPPSRARRITSLAPASRLLEIPGVEAVDLLAAAGDAADWRRGFLNRVQDVWATAPDRETAREIVQEVERVALAGLSFEED
jgi:biotin carboxylase